MDGIPMTATDLELKPKNKSKGGSSKQKITGTVSRRRDCHFADIPSPLLLKHLLEGEGVQQNDILADG